jgi:glycosyltransferase involved in cell wall biosynthesis
MTRKLRVLHIIPNFGPGGAERLLVNLLEAFDHERFDVVAVSLYPESSTILEKEIMEKGLKVYFLNKRRGLDLRMIPQLYRLFRAFHPDVVHTHLSVLRYTLLPTLFCHVPVRLHTVHNVAQKEVDRVGKLVHWLAFRLGNVVPVSISQEVANTVRSVYGRGIHTPVIYNGIPTTRFVSSAGRGNAKKEKGVVLLHVGRFAPQKNHLLLIEAFALAVKEYPTMQLWLVGDGPLRPAVEKAIVEMRLEGKVLFLGIRDDVPKLLAGCEAFILSSDYEGMPLAVLEAMAAGKPVVATAVGAVPEVVKNAVTGILVPPRDAKALAQAMIQLANNPELRQRFGRAGQKRAMEMFDITRTAREYEALYLKLFEGCKKGCLARLETNEICQCRGKQGEII